MKKFLCIFSFLILCSLAAPVFAHPGGGPGGPGMMPTPHHHGVIRAGMHYRMPPRHHYMPCHYYTPRTLVGGTFVSTPMVYYNDFYTPSFYSNGVYVNIGVPVRF